MDGVLFGLCSADSITTLPLKVKKERSEVLDRNKLWAKHLPHRKVEASDMAEIFRVASGVASQIVGVALATPGTPLAFLPYLHLSLHLSLSFSFLPPFSLSCTHLSMQSICLSYCTVLQYIFHTLLNCSPFLLHLKKKKTLPPLSSF